MEASDLQQGTDISLHPNISPSVFITSNVDLESEQYYIVYLLWSGYLTYLFKGVVCRQI